MQQTYQSKRRKKLQYYILSVLAIVFLGYIIYVVYFLSSTTWKYVSIYIRPSETGLNISTEDFNLTKTEKQLTFKTTILLQMESIQDACDGVISDAKGNVVFSERVSGLSTFIASKELYSIELCGKKKTVDLRPY